VCSDTYFYSYTDDECIKCDESCASCDGSLVFDCVTCASGHYEAVGADKLCLPYCATGFTANQGTGKCDGTAEDLFCQSFNAQSADYTVDSNGHTYELQSLPESDPVPIYLRGLWFDGTDYLQLTGVTLHTSFTL
jgi:hypothetical protein